MTLQGFMDSLGCLVLLWTTMSISVGMSVYLLLQHLLHYNNHRLQSYVVRIIVFMPIYGILTFLLYLFPRFVDILEMMRNIWEGLLIHSFLCLMMEYCGGESNCGEVITRDPAVIKHFWPINRIKAFSLSDDIPLNVGFVKRCRMGTMQYAFIRPSLAILSIIYRMIGIEDSLIVRLINWLSINVSVYLALYALGLFYVATRNHPGLANANCLIKCISLKMMGVFTFYQGCILSWFTTMEQHAAEEFNTVLVLLELPFFAFLLMQGYPVSEFMPVLDGALESGTAQTDVEAPPSTNEVSVTTETMAPFVLDERFLKVCSTIGINTDDVKTAITPEGREKILNNAGMALNMIDLISDAYHNYSDKYRQHSLLPQTNADDVETSVKAKAPEEKDDNFVENFAEFKKDSTKRTLEEKANTLDKLQLL
uniref:Uncharacterized protein n=1 Tax=Babesia bovis TaxID=5865 RepID=S6B975_BABBO|nr:hypothetical protein [Babesia bovis]